MARKTLTVLSGQGRLSRALVDQSLQFWPQGRPEITCLPTERILQAPETLGATGVAWIIADEQDPGDARQAIAICQEEHVPAIVTGLPGDHQAGASCGEGAVHAPADSPPAVICALLRAMWSQAVVIRNLHTEVSFLRAHQGGLCDQVQKMDEELRLAAQLQREFLPAKLPSIDSVAFRVLFRPASYVSGDIYDVLRLDENHIGFFLADAVGHGVPAALMTMYIKRSLHTKEVDPDSPRGYRIIPPDEALARLNKDMVAQQSGSKIRFATACYGVINCKTLEMNVARAGHPFPLLLGQDGTTKWFEPEGAMLGVFPEEVYEVAHHKLKDGDRLLLYSDGFEMAFPEVQDKKITVANTQYTREFEALANGTLDEAIEHLEGRLDLQAGSLNQRDDLTVVCLGVNSQANTSAASNRTDANKTGATSAA